MPPSRPYRRRVRILPALLLGLVLALVIDHLTHDKDSVLNNAEQKAAATTDDGGDEFYPDHGAAVSASVDVLAENRLDDDEDGEAGDVETEDDETEDGGNDGVGEDTPSSSSSTTTGTAARERASHSSGHRARVEHHNSNAHPSYNVHMRQWMTNTWHKVPGHVAVDSLREKTHAGIDAFQHALGLDFSTDAREDEDDIAAAMAVLQAKEQEQEQELELEDGDGATALTGTEAE